MAILESFTKIDWMSAHAQSAVIAGLITFIVGLLIGRFEKVRHKRKLNKGDFDRRLLVQNHQVLGDLEGSQVLCFTTEKIVPDISTLFPNSALDDLLCKRAAKTSDSAPLVDLSGQGEHIFRDIVSYLSETIKNLDGRYLILITKENQKVVQRKMIRIFLIDLDTLGKFRDWEYAQSINVEKETHWLRILTLHRIAKFILNDNNELKEDKKQYYTMMVFGERVPLDSIEVNWKEIDLSKTAEL